MSSTQRPPRGQRNKRRVQRASPARVRDATAVHHTQLLEYGHAATAAAAAAAVGQELKGPRSELGVVVNGMREEGADVHKGSIREVQAVPHAKLAERTKVREGVARHTAAVEVQDREDAAQGGDSVAAVSLSCGLSLTPSARRSASLVGQAASASSVRTGQRGAVRMRRPARLVKLKTRARGPRTSGGPLCWPPLVT
jgi:hypothetical protein